MSDVSIEEDMRIQLIHMYIYLHDDCTLYNIAAIY
jgi:hypothetical protein